MKTRLLTALVATLIAGRALAAGPAAPAGTPKANDAGPRPATDVPGHFTDPGFQEDSNDAHRRIVSELKRLQLDGRSAFLLHDNRGLRALLDGSAEEAAISFREAIKARPDFQEGYDHLALTLERSGDPAGAAEAYGRLMERWPANSAYYAGKRAGAYLALGKPKEALDDLERALARRPGQPHLLLNASFALLDLGRPLEAAKLFGQAVQKDPTLLRSQEGTCLRFRKEGAEVPACAGFQ